MQMGGDNSCFYNHPKYTISHTANVYGAKYSFQISLLAIIDRSKMDVVNINQFWFCCCCASVSLEPSLRSFYFRLEIKKNGDHYYV